MSLEPFPEDWARALVIVAHPDDVEYPGASFIHRWTNAGKAVSYLIASRGEAGLDSVSPALSMEIRMREQIDAAKAVGVNDVRFLTHPDGVIEDVMRLRREVAESIRLVQPEVVVIGNHREISGNGALNMADHRIVGQAAIDAVRDAANRWVFEEIAHKPWSGVKYSALLGSPIATHAVEVGESFDAGLQSLLAHRTYLSTLGTTDVQAKAMLRAFHETVASDFDGKLGVALEMLR